MTLLEKLDALKKRVDKSPFDDNFKKLQKDMIAVAKAAHNIIYKSHKDGLTYVVTQESEIDNLNNALDNLNATLPGYE